jgi:hypothetical protein
MEQKQRKNLQKKDQAQAKAQEQALGQAPEHAGSSGREQS